jgi:tetratricopeptide (TPR) repeat protein
MTTTGKRPHAGSPWLRATIPLRRTATSVARCFTLQDRAGWKKPWCKRDAPFKGIRSSLQYGASWRCLAAMGRYAEAEEHFRQALALDRNFSIACYYFADFYAARGMFAEALPFAEKAFSFGPGSMLIIGLYAGLLVRTGEQERGEEMCPGG